MEIKVIPKETRTKYNAITTRQDSNQAYDSMLTPSLEADTKWFDRFGWLTALRLSKGKLTILSKVEGPMGFPPWSSGPLLHRGEKRQLYPLVENGDGNRVFDIT